MSSYALAYASNNVFSNAVSIEYAKIQFFIVTNSHNFSSRSLLEISNPRNLMFSMCDTRNGNLALPYHNSDSPNQYNFGPKTNTYRRYKNYQRSFRNGSGSHIRPIEHNYESNDNRSVDLKKHNPVSESQRCMTKDSQKPEGLIPIPTGTKRPVSNGARKCDEPINLQPLIEESKKPIPLPQRTQCTIPKEPLGCGKLITDLSSEVELLMSDEPQKWREPFALESGTQVTVQYFVETPTTTCWVMQNQHAKKKNYLLEDIKKLHCKIGALPRNEINEKKVYCVELDDIYYRGVVLCIINSKEVFVRLIDDGRALVTQISAIKKLDHRLKFINAFAIEINFESSLEIHIGQVLNIEKVSIDAVGAMNVTLGKEENTYEIPLLPLPLGVPMKLFCLDYSNVEMGYISASIHDHDKIESINGLSDKIVAYLRKAEKAEKYYPKLDDLCLAYHDSEKQWYRAECIKVINMNCFEVLFIDYGLTKIVTSSNIRKIVPQFMEPAIMHFCRIYGKFLGS